MKRWAILTVLFLLGVNLAILVAVGSYKKTKLNQARKNQIEIQEKVENIASDYRQAQHYQDGFDSSLNNHTEAIKRSALFSSVALYSRYYYDETAYHIPVKWSGCKTDLTISNIEVWCLTNHRNSFESLTNDRIIVSGMVTYNYECKGIRKSDGYTFWNYQLPNSSDTFYDDINDPERLYITVEAAELANADNRNCDVRFFRYVGKQTWAQITDTVLNAEPSEQVSHN